MTDALYIKPAAILTDGQKLEHMAVLVQDGRIAALAHENELSRPAGAREIVAEGLLLAPGLVDLQINGAFGSDFTAEPDSIWKVAERLPQYGVTAFLPTIITSPLETVAAAQSVVCGGAPEGFRGATPLGLHLEGPYLNPAKRGAHNPEHLRLPDTGETANWSPESGVRMVTLAPELPGGLDMVKALAARGVVVSAGHSMATFEQARLAISAGVTYGTHLFNAMPLVGHREPGLAGALLADPNVTVGLIADGVHVHPATVELAWRVKGAGRLNLVTDAMSALGMPPGCYRLGDQQVSVRDGTARTADGTLAGSVLSLDQAVRNLVRFTGCAAADAVAVATRVPATLLGLGHLIGTIAPGVRANLVLLSQDLHVVTTMVGGETIYSASSGS